MLVFKTVIVLFVLKAEHEINYANNESQSEKNVREKWEIFILQKLVSLVSKIVYVLFIMHVTLENH